MPADAYSPRRYRYHSPMRAKHCQPNHPMQKEAPQSSSGKIRRQIKTIAYAECQVEDHLMRVKELIVIAIARFHREVRGRWTPSRVRDERFSRPRLPQCYLRWDIGAISWPEPDLNAVISRFRHDIVSATIVVKCSTVGEATVREDDPTPLIEVDGGVAIGADGSSATLFFSVGACTRDDAYPVCGRFQPAGGIVHPGRVCRVAWFSVFKLTPTREKGMRVSASARKEEKRARLR